MTATIAGDVNRGGPFTIKGTGLGTTGTVTMGGVALKVTSWTPTRIKGIIPPSGVSGGIRILTSAGDTTAAWVQV